MKIVYFSIRRIDYFSSYILLSQKINQKFSSFSNLVDFLLLKSKNSSLFKFPPFNVDFLKQFFPFKAQKLFTLKIVSHSNKKKIVSFSISRLSNKKIVYFQSGKLVNNQYSLF